MGNKARTSAKLRLYAQEGKRRAESVRSNRVVGHVAVTRHNNLVTYAEMPEPPMRLEKHHLRGQQTTPQPAPTTLRNSDHSHQFVNSGNAADIAGTGASQGYDKAVLATGIHSKRGQGRSSNEATTAASGASHNGALWQLISLRCHCIQADRLHAEAHEARLLGHRCACDENRSLLCAIAMQH